MYIVHGAVKIDKKTKRKPTKIGQALKNNQWRAFTMSLVWLRICVKEVCTIMGQRKERLDWWQQAQASKQLSTRLLQCSQHCQDAVQRTAAGWLRWKHIQRLQDRRGKRQESRIPMTDDRANGITRTHTHTHTHTHTQSRMRDGWFTDWRFDVVAQQWPAATTETAVASVKHLPAGRATASSNYFVDVFAASL